MILDQPLVCDTLELRAIDGTHATPAYLNWLRDPEVNRYLEVRFSPPPTLASLAQYIEAVRNSPKELFLGMFLPGDLEHIGNIKLGPMNRAHRTAEIGLLIGERSEWGKGHAATAISMISDYAFKDLDLCKLTAGCYSPNVGSIKSFLKAGFVQEGLRLGQWQTDGGRCDGVLLGRLRPDCTATRC